MSGNYDASNDAALVNDKSTSSSKGLLDAYAEIEQYSIAEENGAEVQARYFTFRDRIEYFMVGMKSTFFGGIISLLFIPLAMGVIEHKVPAFGSWNPTLMDQIFVFILAMSFTLGYAFFYAAIGQLYVGNITKAMIRNLLGGVTCSAVVKLVIAIVAYNMMYFFVMTEDNILLMLNKMTFFERETLLKIYQWLMDFRPILLESMVFVFITTCIMIIVPWASVMIKKWRSRKGQLKYTAY